MTIFPVRKMQKVKKSFYQSPLFLSSILFTIFGFISFVMTFVGFYYLSNDFETDKIIFTSSTMAIASMGILITNYLIYNRKLFQ